MKRAEPEDPDPEDAGIDAGSADEAEVVCPHCGEQVAIRLDPSGGTRQEYVQDCEVCCRPWQVQVHYAGGSVDVSVEPA